MDVSKIQEVLDEVFAIDKLRKAVAGGLSFGEIAMAVSALKGGEQVLADAGLAWNAYKGMSDADAIGLENYIVSQYGANPDKIEQIIEQALKGAIELHSLAGLL